MIIKAAAKINLVLDILSRTDDGYHTVFMIMQSVGIRDVVTVNLTQEPGTIRLTCSESSLPTDSSNIGYKAAEVFFAETGIANPGVSIDIEKHIPFAAGLAGGSADAAAVLTGLNRLTKAGLSDRQLCRIGVMVGADVPFCIQGGTMLALDIGEVLAPLPDARNDWYVIVKPDQDVSTKAAYAAFDKTRNIRHLDRDALLHAAVNEDYETLYSKLGNVFEQLVEVADRVEIKAVMRGCGSSAYCMSGSGPSIFGIFEEEESAEICAQALRVKGYKNVFVCRPLRRSIEVEEG